MGKNLVQKIIDAHVVNGVSEAGAEAGIRIDQTLTQDATGTMAYLQFEALGFDRVKTDLSVSYVDHNTVQEGFENADDHAYLRSVASKYGVRFSRAGNGVCHQVHLERFGCPGKTLLGSDSHTPTCGGIGMIAIGAGGLDVAVAMGGGPFYLAYPKVIRVELRGVLPEWVSAKDVILKVLETLSTKGNVGCVLEYGGEGVGELTVPQRATITNMGAETGVTTSVFPSDEQTRTFLEAQGRGECYRELSADRDCAYERVVEIDLSALEPLVACPHSPGNIKSARELAGTKVDQVLIGSCTNSSYADLMTVASALKGRKVASNVSFGVAPGSRQVFGMIAGNGALAEIIASGARVLESACGFCIGNSLAPKTKGISLRTNNRNFQGRSGTADAEIYLSSPETAVASALAGEIVDPRVYFRDLSIRSPQTPEHFAIDDSMVIEPLKDSSRVEIVRGPNIGAPPQSDPLPDTLDGVVAIRLGDKTTTDHIMPAGNRLKFRSNIPKYAQFVFERNDPDFPGRAMENKKAGLHNVIVAGESYGQGSSREHAAICPMYLGVKVVMAKSIERIHRSNLINFGILPVVFAELGDYECLEQGQRLEAAGIVDSVKGGSELVFRLQGSGAEIRARLELSGREREILLAGGLLNTLRR